MTGFSKPSGSFGNNHRLSGLMDYGPQPLPEMSMTPATASIPEMASLAPSLSFTGENGQIADISGMGQMNYGMSPVGNDVAAGFPAPEGGGIMGMLGGLFNKKTMLGGRNADGSSDVGVLPAGLGAVQGIASLYMGMQQYGLAKKQLAEGKRRFDLEYGANKNLTNSRMEDRQRARVASNAGAYESVGTYMNKNGIK